MLCPLEAAEGAGRCMPSRKVTSALKVRTSCLVPCSLRSQQTALPLPHAQVVSFELSFVDALNLNS